MQKLAEFIVKEDGEKELNWDNTYAKVIKTTKKVLCESRPRT